MHLTYWFPIQKMTDFSYQSLNNSLKPFNPLLARVLFQNIMLFMFLKKCGLYDLFLNSNLTSYIGYINKVVIKPPKCFNSHMRMV